MKYYPKTTNYSIGTIWECKYKEKDGREFWYCITLTYRGEKDQKYLEIYEWEHNDRSTYSQKGMEDTYEKCRNNMPNRIKGKKFQILKENA